MWTRFVLAGLSIAPFGLILSGVGQGAPPQRTVAFSKDVMPIFRAHCYSCHKGKTSAAGLDLSTAQGVAKGGLSGKLIKPGKPKDSLLIKRVLGMGGLPQMPMGFAPLTKAQLKTLETWILSGAKLEAGTSSHWAYVPPLRPAIPMVKNKDWVANPIDAFVLARLAKGGLKPSAQAAPESLIRRVSLDLVGLPPTLEEVNGYVADKRQDTYGRAVDRLLKSPHFGERQARIWLDLARYADTNGYEADYTRTAWKYRDWVIDAFNRNMPYDQFTVEQLAGDMLPKPSLDQLIATGFHRNTMLNLEGGVDPREARYEMINDRVATTSSVWLGQTLQCARCHDHKYDPISQKDYFRVYAVFANTLYEAQGDSKVGQEKFYEPSIPAPTSQDSQSLALAERSLANARLRFESNPQDYLTEKADWLAKISKSDAWSLTKGGGPGLTIQADGSLLATDGNPDVAVYRVSFPVRAGTQALRMVAMPDPKLNNGGPGRSSGGNFLLSRVSALAGSVPLTLVDPEASFVQGGYRLADLFDKNGDTGWAISPDYGKDQWLVLRFERPITSDQTITIELGQESPTWAQHTIGRFRIETTMESDRTLQVLPMDIIALAKQSRTPPQEKRLDDFFRKISKILAESRDSVKKFEEEVVALKRAIPMAMVMREKPGANPLTAPLHIRGEFLQTGPNVTAGVPLALGKTDAKRVDRLAFAKWLIDKKNPLTARVQVNRMWEQYFGRGLVETSENWGTPGTPPSHPELLDWLACELMDSGWNLKHIHRLIVTSATYRQSSNVTPVLLQRDPNNFLFTRGPRFRMEAEMIRDNALSIAGLLSTKIGGPSVFPHQPNGIWNSPYSGERWMTSSDQNLYRRGLYTFWKRTATYPTFTNFDATSRDTCTVRRSRTNTPLQALNLLNDPAFLEAAKGLAKIAIRTGGNDQLRLEMAFRKCTMRSPKRAELSRLTVLLDNLRKRYRANPIDSAKLAPSPDDAAWIMVASVLLNLDETITKE